MNNQTKKVDFDIDSFLGLQRCPLIVLKFIASKITVFWIKLKSVNCYFAHLNVTAPYSQGKIKI